MFLLSVLAFFVFIYILVTLTVAIAWLAFLKSQAEGAAAGQSSGDPETALGQDSTLFRSERLSTLNFWDSLLARFDVAEILKVHLMQAELNWSVGRVTLAMLLSATVSFLVFWKIFPLWVSLLAAVGVGFSAVDVKLNA